MKSLVALYLLACLVCPALGGRFSGSLSAQSDGDDPNASALVNLLTSRDQIVFNATLFNTINVTGVHLHLSPSPGAVFGGPLLVALTNTTAANGQAPVSSSGSSPLVQSGVVTVANLLANPQLANARNTLVTNLTVQGNNLESINDLVNLIEQGLVYSDIHTTARVSPLGLIRGRMSELACSFYTPQGPSTPAASPPPFSAPPAPVGLGNPCYCAPQSDAYRYCFNYVQATTDVNCSPPAGLRCNVLAAANAPKFSNQAGPVYQCQ